MLKNGAGKTVLGVFDLEPGGGGSSPLTTKGDIFGYSSANARIPVGTDGQVLTAASSQALGVKWSTGAPGSLSQAYYGYNTIGGSNTAMVTGTAYQKQITLASPGMLISIDAYVKETSITSVSNIGCFIMTDNAGVPGDVLALGMMYPNPPSLNLASNNARWLSMPCSVWLPAATYWIVVQKQDTNGVLNLYYDGSGSDYTQTNTGKWASDGVANTGVSGAPASGSNKYSLRASVAS